MSASRDEIRKVAAHAERLFSPEEVDVAVDRMAAEMNAALAEKDPLLLCVMTGGVVPTGLLLPRLRFPLELDYLHVSR
ncbi:MAG: hypoxanthine-guanine phosphoribosyltransferase, partial [Gammaproteobacteria bacterium]